MSDDGPIRRCARLMRLPIESILISLLMSLCLGACATASGRDLSERSSDADESMEIYSIVLRDGFVEPNTHLLLVRALPIICYFKPDDSQLWPALYKAQEAPRALTTAPQLEIPVHLLTESELESIGQVSDPVGWPALTARFPKAQGVVEVSAIGFDPSHRTALVAARFVCGQRCGVGGVWELESDGVEWKIRRRTQSWKS